MGVDKATLVLPGASATLAVRAAAALVQVADPVVEVGRGTSGLRHVEDAGLGPLVAIVAGLDALGAGERPVLVLACDMPRVTADVLRGLADHPAPGSVIPTQGDHPQPLCARWSPTAQASMRDEVAAGRRSLRPLTAGPDVTLVAVIDPAVLDDVDTPEDVRRITGRS
jgi:molybdopterin-guanine dinucleotide biosynthesis protein A